ncbi:MAG: FemAB family XrtA/PEP-CTERM system-associated protein [Gemmatimonadales bacterium]
MVIEPWRGTPQDWDAFASRQHGCTHFQRYAWKDLIERVHGHECLYLATLEDGQLRGVLPLIRVKSLIFGHYLVSMPFLNYGGPLGDKDAVRALADHAAMLARDGGAKLMELRSRLPLPVDLPVSHRKITVVLDLPEEGSEALWKAIPAKVRSQVRRPGKEGVEVRFGPGQVEPFYHVFSRHMRDLGTPAQPRELFESIARSFPDDSWFVCAWFNGKPVACGAGFRWNDEFEMTWASALAEYNRIAPNMLLYWSFMEHAMEAGLKLFNFGRCTPDSGTHRFKRQWGSRDEQLHWYQVSRTDSAATPSPDQGAWSWGPRLWKHLPLPVAGALGGRIVRYIP